MKENEVYENSNILNEENNNENNNNNNNNQINFIFDLDLPENQQNSDDFKLNEDYLNNGKNLYNNNFYHLKNNNLLIIFMKLIRFKYIKFKYILVIILYFFSIF